MYFLHDGVVPRPHTVLLVGDPVEASLQVFLPVAVVGVVRGGDDAEQ